MAHIYCGLNRFTTSRLIGYTLLERNTQLKNKHKQTVEEQEQEIVYLKKHLTDMRVVNDSRL